MLKALLGVLSGFLALTKCQRFGEFCEAFGGVCFGRSMGTCSHVRLIEPEVQLEAVRDLRQVCGEGVARVRADHRVIPLCRFLKCSAAQN